MCTSDFTELTDLGLDLLSLGLIYTYNIYWEPSTKALELENRHFKFWSCPWQTWFVWPCFIISTVHQKCFSFKHNLPFWLLSVYIAYFVQRGHLSTILHFIVMLLTSDTNLYLAVSDFLSSTYICPKERCSIYIFYANDT